LKMRRKVEKQELATLIVPGIIVFHYDPLHFNLVGKKLPALY